MKPDQLVFALIVAICRKFGVNTIKYQLVEQIWRQLAKQHYVVASEVHTAIAENVGMCLIELSDESGDITITRAGTIFIDAFRLPDVEAELVSNLETLEPVPET